jgi:hypothetical protein
MLKGTRTAVFRNVEPISIHGQISWDIYFTDPERPEAPVQVARVGPEAVAPNLRSGDLIELDYIFGVVTSVRRSEH